jgi:hypothetical protein
MKTITKFIFGFPMLALASGSIAFAVQSAKAVGPEPNDDNLIGNGAEEANAVPDVGSATGNAGRIVAVGKKINGKLFELPTRFEAKTGQCAGGEKVLVGGKLKISFVVGTRNGKQVVLPKTVEEDGKLFLPKDASKGVGGEGQSSHRTYKVDKVKVEIKLASPSSSGGGRGIFLLRIFFVAKTNPVNTAQGDVNAGKNFTFSVVYKEVNYSWNKNNGVQEVTYRLDFVGAECP